MPSEAEKAQVRQDTLLSLRERMKPLQAPASARAPSYCLATGVAALDQALGGGIAQGKITEFVGKGSNGRTALAVSLVARVSNGLAIQAPEASGRSVAWVDAGDCLDVASLKGAGVEMSRVLWLRRSEKQAAKQALKAVNLLIGSQDFSLLVLDLVGSGFRKVTQRSSWWMRISRKLQTSKAALLVLAQEPAVFQPSCRVVFSPRQILSEPLSFNVMHRGCGEVRSLSPVQLRRPAG